MLIHSLNAMDLDFDCTVESLRSFGSMLGQTSVWGGPPASVFLEAPLVHFSAFDPHQEGKPWKAPHFTRRFESRRIGQPVPDNPGGNEGRLGVQEGETRGAQPLLLEMTPCPCWGPELCNCLSWHLPKQAVLCGVAALLFVRFNCWPSFSRAD